MYKGLKAGKINKVFVTGGTGFIGSHLVEELINKNIEVIVGDIHIDPHSHFIMNQLHRKAIFEIFDIRINSEVEMILDRYKPDYIIHLAAQTIVNTAFNYPRETLETNILGTINILEYMRAHQYVKGLIFASSDKAYGKSMEMYKEDFPLHGDHPYDVSKSSGDLIVQTYNKTYNIPTVIARFGNVYGEGDLHFNRLVPGICESIIKNKPLLIRSNGKYVRDYLYVKDVVKGYILLLELFESITGEAFNFSSSEKLSVLKVINLAERILKQKIPYEILNSANNEIPYQHLDDTKIRMLGWNNEYTFENTLQNIVSWYKQIL